MNPHIAFLLTDAWAMEPAALSALRDALAAGDWKVAATMEPEDEEREPYGIRGATAVIPVSGVLLNGVPEWMRAYGVDATSYRDIRTAIAKANNDPAVERIVLAVSSPGGQVSGIHTTADAIRDSKKEIVAEVDGMAASAAYWLASQTSEIRAERGAQIGSIGVYTVLRDTSGLQEQIGVRLEVVGSGGVKGAGADGRVTDALREDVKRGIMDTFSQFVGEVAAGRGLSEQDVLTNATGQVWSAAEAKARRLIDAVSGPQDYATMDAFALIEKHPAHAALVASLAKTGAPVADIERAIKDADSAAALASLTAERDALKAKADAEAARADKAEADAAAHKAAAEKAAADLAALKAIADGGKPGAKVQAGEPVANTKTAEELEAMSPSQRAKFYADGGTIAN